MSLLRYSVIMVVIFLLSGCGRSIFEPISSNDSDEAIKLDIVNYLDKDEFVKAEEKLKILWAKSKANDIAQLYAVTLLGKGDFSVFEIVKNALKLSSDSGAGGTDIMNQMATNSEALLGGTITATRQSYAKQALDVLRVAEDQTSTGLLFQKCLTAGIYSVPILQVMARAQAKLAEVQAIQASGSFCTSGSVETMGNSITSLISDAGALSGSIAAVEDVLTTCLPSDTTQNVNQITSMVQKILTTADKGCAVIDSQIQTIGTVALPVCLNSYVSATTTGAVAGDNVISGCELFLHCAGGGCM